MLNYKKYIKEVQDFPKEGVSFKDISPLLADWQTFETAIVQMGNLYRQRVRTLGVHAELHVDHWVGIDARGFLFAGALSYAFGGGIVMCRKSGKLPPAVIGMEYNLEYGKDSLEIKPGKGNVIIVDDVLATGGTLQTVNQLCKSAGYDVIGNLVLIDLQYIPRPSFNLEVKSLIQYE